MTAVRSFPCRRDIGPDESSSITWLEVDCGDAAGSRRLEALRTRFRDKNYCHFILVKWKGEKKYRYATSSKFAQELSDALRLRGSELKDFGLGSKINNNGPLIQSGDLIRDPELESLSDLDILPEPTMPLQAVPLQVLDLDTVGSGVQGVGWNRTRTLALPLLCADDWYAIEPNFAAKIALAAVDKFLSDHQEVRIYVRFVSISSPIAQGSMCVSLCIESHRTSVRK